MALRPTRRLIGEAGPEAVIPLHKLGDLGRRMGGGLVVNVGGINVGGGQDPDAVAAYAGAAVAKAVRESLTYRRSIYGPSKRSLV